MAVWERFGGLEVMAEVVYWCQGEGEADGRVVGVLVPEAGMRGSWAFVGGGGLSRPGAGGDLGKSFVGLYNMV